MATDSISPRRCAASSPSLIERYYTPEQLAQLERRREALGDEGMAKAQGDWSDLIAEVEAERARGTDPSSPRVRELARRWQELVERFTGGDPGIRASLHAMYAQEGVARASRGAMSPELMAYIQRAGEVER